MGFYTFSFATAQVNNVFCDNVLEIIVFHPCFKYDFQIFSLRCNIPVIVMGETGCGKTRLIRFMCGLQAGPNGPRNMLLLKVGIGTFKCKRTRCRICPFISNIVKISGPNSCKITDPFTCISVKRNLFHNLLAM